MPRNHALCAFSGCSHPCKGFTQYCPKHDRAKSITGHPSGRILRTRDLIPYRSIADETLRQYSDTPPVKAAVELCDHILQINTDELGKQMARLRDQYARGDEMLSVILTVWLYADYNRRELPDDVRLTMQLGHHVLHLRPNYRRAPYQPAGNRNPYLRPNSRVVRRTGELVRAKFGVFLKQLTARIEKRTIHEAKLTQEVRGPIADGAVTWST